MKSLLKYTGITFLLLIAIIGIAGISAYILLPRPTIAALNLDSKEQIMNRLNTGVILLDRNGQEFSQFYEGRHVNPTPINQIPKSVREAFISAEDKDFYTHNGYSLTGIAGAALANIRHQNSDFGGSTITQQLAKNSFLTPEKSFIRKYQELLLSRQLEKYYSKDEILEMYLNSVYFGEGAFGIGEASKTYFSKTPTELSISQAAMLAAVVNAPSALSPISGDTALAKTRQELVLSQMKKYGYLSEEQRISAEGESLELKPDFNTSFKSQAPHFALMVKQELINKFGEETIARSGFIVHTSIDLNWQKKVEEEVAKQIELLSKDDVSNGAAVVMDPKTGEIRALVGSADWNNEEFGKFNVASAKRQPGSSFKPLVYLSALEKGTITAASILKDQPTTFGKDYKPLNYDLKFRGPVTVRRSLANSLNIPTVEIQQKVGVQPTLDLAKRLGISSLDGFSNNDLSLSLGSGEVSPLEMTSAFATLSNSGMHNQPTVITKIINKEGASTFSSKPESKRAIDPKYTFLISSILSDTNARKEVFGDALTISRPAAVKTGTSQDYRDSWTIGYTPSLTIGVWVGNNDGTPMQKIAGSLGAAPIWRNLMESFSKDTPIEQFIPPADILQLNICKGRGLKVPENVTGSSVYKEYFVKGTEPTQNCVFPKRTPAPTESPAAPEEPVTIEPETVTATPTPVSIISPSPTIPPSPSPTPKDKP